MTVANEHDKQERYCETPHHTRQIGNIQDYVPPTNPLNVINLYHTIPCTSRCPILAIHCGRSSFSQQSLQFSHRRCYHNFSITFNENIQLSILSRFWVFACCIERSLRCNGRSSCFKDFGDIGPISDGPSGFLCYIASVYHIQTT